MKRVFLAAAVVFALALVAGAQQTAVPAATPPIPAPAQLDQAIEDFAQGIPAGITADRYAAFAIEMPKDEAEYKALNKHALLVVAALAKDASELPLKRVYLEQDQCTLELPPIAYQRRKVPADSAAGKLMGTHRVDAYYLIPLSAWRQPGTLLADFGAHREQFVLGKFPQPIREDFVRDDTQPSPEPFGRAEGDAIHAIVKRTAPGKPEFVKPPRGAGIRSAGIPVGDGSRVVVSSGVAAGLLVHRVEPSYTGQKLEGDAEVVLRVFIGKDGTVREVRPLSGNPLLVAAAIEAVRQWRYRPYLLHCEPVEVDTQVTVLFRH